MTVVLTPWKNQLLRRCSEANRIRLVCPFVKAGIARSIIANARPGTEIDLVTRNKPSDFAAGVSDIDALKAFFVAEEMGIRFSLSVINSVHAKVFIFDDEVCYVGSSNLTSAGLERSLEGTVQITDRSAVAEWIGVHALMKQRAKAVLPDDIRDFECGTVAYASRHRVSKTDEGSFYSVAQADDALSTITAVYTSAEERASPLSPTFHDRIDELVEARFDPPSIGHMLPHEKPQAEPVAENVSMSVKTVDGNAPTRPDRTPPPEAVQILTEFPPLAFNLFQLPAWVGPVSCVHALVHSSALQDVGAIEIESRSLATDGETLLVLHQVGLNAFLSAMAIVYARSGLLSRYGVAFCSALTATFRGLGFLQKAWRSNLMPDPLTLARAGETKAARRRIRTEAAQRLLGVASLAKGQNDFVDFVEASWNPLVEYGSDIIEFAIAKDPKTKMQEIAHLLKIKPIYDGYVSTGTDHQPEWKCSLTVGRWGPVEGNGPFKKAAEFDACQRLESASAGDPLWRGAIRDYRAQKFVGYMSGGPWPLRYRGHLKPEIAERLLPIRDRLGLPLEVPQLYGCIINPHVRGKERVNFDNSPLAYVGSCVLAWAISSWIFTNGHSASHAILTNPLVARVSPRAEIEALYEAAGFIRHLTPPFREECFQAIVGSLALFGPEGSAMAFVRGLLDRIDVAEVLASPRGGRGLIVTLASVKDGIGPFTEKGDYITVLQEFAYALGKQGPYYEAGRDGGLDHSPTFKATVMFRTYAGVGIGRSIKAARGRAAHDLLSKLKGIDLQPQE